MSKPTSDRDSSIDRLLPRALEVRGASAPSDACLDAETLAAWADEALSRAEKGAVEAHVADCARCQALLASMIAITPAPISVSSRWRLPSAGWLIPVTAAAAAAIVWVAVPLRPTRQQRTQSPVEVAEASHPTSATSADAKTAPDAPRLAPQKSKAAKDTAGGTGDTSRGAAPAAPVAANTEARAGKAQTMAGAIASKPPATSVAPLVSPELIGPRQSADAVATPAPAPSIAPGAVPAPMKSEARAFGAAAMPVIASPESAVRWRIVPGGNVERTADGGATWQVQETGASETLAAGASPSPLVCWLVGPHGIVLLSTDGRSWRQIEFPADVALVAVRADDERTATVTAVDGRKFSTSDAGRTWGS